MSSADIVRQADNPPADRRILSVRFGSAASCAVLAEFNHEIRLILTSNDRALQSCVVLAVAEVEIHIESHRVLLSRDAGQGAACVRTALREQADRHVQTNLDCLADAQRRVEAALLAAMRELKPVEGVTRNPAIVTRGYKRILAGPVEAAIDAALADARVRHQSLVSGSTLRDALSRCPA